MHSRVGPARTLWQNLFCRDSSNGSGEGALHGYSIGLHLPSGKVSSVIGEDHFEIAHAAIFRVFFPAPIIEGASGCSSNLSGRSMEWRKSACILVGYTKALPRNSGFDP